VPPPFGNCEGPNCSQDCQPNGIPDECEPDCNGNGRPDDCDIAAGYSLDCQPNGIPDECELIPIEFSLSFPLDTDPAWTTTGLWAFGHPTGQGSHAKDPSNGHTGPNVYGYSLSGDYTNNMPARYLTTTPINCVDVTNAELHFWRWLGVESSDHASVEVSNDGTTWVPVWVNAGTISESSWSHQVYDISAVADQQASAYVRWVMGPTDAAVTYPGWNIDDVEMHGVVYANDCNGNGIPDDCDIAAGTSSDANGDGIPDECQTFGACCLAGESCLLQSPAECASAGGTYQGDGSLCDPNPCIYRGDLNCDGTVDFGDINPFVLILSNFPAWQAAYPGCPWQNGDISGDGSVGFEDINPFVALLSGR